MSKILVTLQNYDFKPSEKYFFLGFCNYKKKISLKNKDVKFFDEKLSVDEKYKIYKYCEDISEKIINNLTSVLNKLHSENYHPRIWKLIYGRWLMDFIYVSYKNFSSLEKICKENSFEKIVTSEPDDNFFVTCRSNSIAFANINSDWNSDLCARILKFFNYKIEHDFIKNNQKSNYENTPAPKKNFFVKIKNILNILMVKLNIINKEIFFYDTGLKTFFEKKCELMVNKSLSFWQLPLNKISNTINYELRKKISLDLNSVNNFELFLKQNISIILPRFLIEDYKSINQLLNNLKLPKNPKAIVTGMGYANEIFNIYTAKMVSKKTKFITLQHGNISDSHYWHDFIIESGFQDLKLTWGIKSNKRQLPLFNFKTINSKIAASKNGNLSIVCNNYYSRPHPFELNLENILSDTIDLIKNIDNKIQEKTYFKLFPGDFNNTNEFFKKILNNSNLKYYQDRINYHQMLEKSRITIFNYESSGFFENLALNLPCCYYSTNAYEDIKDDYKKFYKNLEMNKILFTSKSKIISHIFNIWDNVEDWWFSENVQKSIEYFNSNLNIPYNKNQNKLINILKEQV